MKFIKILSALCFCFSFIAACKAQKNGNSCGVVITKLKGYDSLTHTYTMETIFPDIKVWYNDSMAIEEIKAVNINTTDGVTTVKTPVAYYVFIDLRTKSFYHYATFTDTAKILRSYSQPDSILIQGIGGWSFYAKRKINFAEPPLSISDTTIDNITYKRMYFKSQIGGRYTDIISYFRCDKTDTLFQINKSFNEEIKCPMVRMDELPTAQNTHPVSSEIEFLKNTLTPAEQKVFAAWEKNAKEKPAQQLRIN